MSTKRLLLFILALSVAGVAFSGYLTFQELAGASDAVACTPVGEPGTVLGYPPCIYGLAMYLTIVALTVLALRSLRRTAA